ncbi:MAG: hypothetical protein JWQ21_2203 [Herminiimonas sp.]|nr:hypothetical protein [Herminiimonas sp.]
MMRYALSDSKMRPALMVVVIALIVSAIYGQFLWNPLVFDDNNFFGGAIHPEYLKPDSLLNIRGLPYASFEWTRVLVGLQMKWFRLGNLALHIAAAVTLFAFLRRLFDMALSTETVAADAAAGEALPPFWLAFFGTLIFALHPAAVYAAAYLIQRSTLMATLFTLVTWYLLLEGISRNSRWWMIASAGAYFLAVFSKEHAIMAPAVALAMLFLVRKPGRRLLIDVWPVFVLYGLIAAFVIFKFKSGQILGQAYEPRGMDMLSMLARLDPEFNPRLAYPLSMLTQSFLFFKYLLVWILPNPTWMSVDMFEDFATRLWSWPQSAGLIGFVLYPIAAVWLLLKRGKKGLLGFGLLCPWLMFATELSTVRIQETFVLYRSYLWMPGVFAAMPFLFEKAPAKRTAAILTALIIVMIPVTWTRLVTFSSPLLLWNDAARLIKGKDNRPGVERIYHNRGLQLSRLGYFKEAIEDYNKVFTLNSKHVLAYNDRGATYLDMKKYPQALLDFSKAIEIDPKFPRPYLGRALTYEELGKPDEALLDYRKLCSLGFVEGCQKLKQVVSVDQAR